MFKQKSLNAIERRKKIRRISFWAMVLLAIVMAVLVFIAYTVD